MKYWIFGAGKYGKECYDLYHQKIDFVGFIDNSVEKEGTYFCGLRVISYNNFKFVFNKESERIIIASSYCSEIYNQLLGDGKECYVDKVYKAGEIVLFENYWDKKILSTCGEELWLKAYFATYPKDYVGTYVDVGAFHPFYASNSQWAYERGWRGINIDANIDCIKLFDKFRPEDKNINCGISDSEGEKEFYIYKNAADMNTFDKNVFSDMDDLEIEEIRKVKVKTLNKILEENGVKSIDFLDIDVEGLDEEIVMSFDWKKYSPQCVLIEILHKHSIEEILDTKIHRKMVSEGYRLSNYAILTAMYVKNDRPNTD